jgi:hypothetical protein
MMEGGADGEKELIVATDAHAQTSWWDRARARLGIITSRDVRQARSDLQRVLDRQSQPVRLYTDYVMLARSYDLYERRYGALGGLMGVLAGASAVVAALSVQLLHPHPRSLTIWGFVFGIGGFLAAAVGSIHGALGGDDMSVARMEVEPGIANEGTINAAISVERYRLQLVRSSARIRVVLAAAVVGVMAIGLILMALGQTALK